MIQLSLQFEYTCLVTLVFRKTMHVYYSAIVTEECFSGETGIFLVKSFMDSESVQHNKIMPMEALKASELSLSYNMSYACLSTTTT